MVLNADDIELAVEVFNNNIESIHTVEEWCKFINYKRPKTFSRYLKIHFGKPAVKVMTELRLARIKELMQSSPQDSLFCIARMVGMKDEKSLYDYIKYHTKISPTSLKKSLVREKFRSEIPEYNIGVKIPSVIAE